MESGTAVEESPMLTRLSVQFSSGVSVGDRVGAVRKRLPLEDENDHNESPTNDSSQYDTTEFADARMTLFEARLASSCLESRSTKPRPTDTLVGASTTGETRSISPLAPLADVGGSADGCPSPVGRSGPIVLPLNIAAVEARSRRSSSGSSQRSTSSSGSGVCEDDTSGDDMTDDYGPLDGSPSDFRRRPMTARPRTKRVTISRKPLTARNHRTRFKQRSGSFVISHNSRPNLMPIPEGSASNASVSKHRESLQRQRSSSVIAGFTYGSGASVRRSASDPPSHSPSKHSPERIGGLGHHDGVVVRLSSLSPGSTKKLAAMPSGPASAPIARPRLFDTLNGGMQPPPPNVTAQSLHSRSRDLRRTVSAKSLLRTPVSVGGSTQSENLVNFFDATAANTTTTITTINSDKKNNNKKRASHTSAFDDGEWGVSDFPVLPRPRRALSVSINPGTMRALPRPNLNFRDDNSGANDNDDDDFTTVGSLSVQLPRKARSRPSDDDDDHPSISANPAKRHCPNVLARSMSSLPDMSLIAPTEESRYAHGQHPRLPIDHEVGGGGTMHYISHETLASLLCGELPEQHEYDVIRIFDCRYTFEYGGGHIRTARNVDGDAIVEELLDSPPRDGTRVCLIFHCEFSEVRGPSAYKQVRSADRTDNSLQYPRLHYPEMYILKGGYKEFYAHHKDLCVGEYVQMKDPAHREALSKATRHRRSGSKRSSSRRSRRPSLRRARSESMSVTRASRIGAERSGSTRPRGGTLASVSPERGIKSGSLRTRGPRALVRSRTAIAQSKF